MCERFSASQHCTKWYALVFCWCIPLAGFSLPLFAENNPVKQITADHKISFAKDILPILKAHCIECHAGAEPESSFSLSTRRTALAGGNYGKAVIPRQPARSLLFQMISGTHPDKIVMPPEGERLSVREIALIRDWIQQGASWPEKLVISTETKNKSQENHWAFQPITKPELPQLKQNNWCRNEIDYFILHRLEQEQISPAATADPTTLIRRVTLDLIGLPPTPEEVAAFVNDTRPDAYERLVDRLLQSPHFGEKWARPWLDLCHYADSDGYLTDAVRPHAWRFRDWVVRSLNQNKPFDQFTIEQIAGDLLPDSPPEAQAGTGFLRQTLSNREGGADLEEFRVNKVVDRTKLMGTIWLGLTLDCCRCHNHKYDPISQKEFYQLYSFFNSAFEVNIDAPLPQDQPLLKQRQAYQQKRQALIDPIREPLEQLQREWEQKMLYAAEHPAEDHHWARAWEVMGLVWGLRSGEGQQEGLEIIKMDPAQRSQRQRDDLLDYFLARGHLVDSARFKELKLGELARNLSALRKEYPAVSRAPAMQEMRTPKQAFVHLRGSHLSPGVPVEPGTPRSLSPFQPEGKPDRLDLAHWLVSHENPLTARVTVNRIWQEYFGQGIVISSDDFGTQGDRPSHPELLDWLAWQFRENGWDIKALHRLIVTSATYRQSSKMRPEIQEKDPANRLLSHQTSLRLSAELVRDQALAVSGLLNEKTGGPCVRPPQPDSVVMEAFGSNTWDVSSGDDRYRRGLYTLILRTSPYAQSVIFDAPNPSQTCTRRDRSNTPLQALTLLNDPVFYEAAQHLGQRVVKESSGDLDQQISYAFRLCMARTPQETERERLKELYREQIRKQPADKAVSEKQAAAWTVVASVLLNLHEFITRD
ncbi:PSD1 and planctomycete cytochrome C domain-containing protein [Gimesia panareensis]|uniref:PSD1 and planctomycete cytochrome C domain-containing protein n=1 Tax=Gimesia panareensis TaxID=2527978 RepID=UPI00118CEE00|nr:PSD1 and planctomycete cytochrome C domain-containing protein [Gimesia panareensis]QDU51580.1 Planctomycete cytochrome C [Gimesia panareensis]